MECRTLNVTLVSANGLTNKPSFFGKTNVYADVSISGVGRKFQIARTPTDKTGGSDATWNFTMKFTVSELAGLYSMLVVKIKAERMFANKNLGLVRVPIKELLNGVTDQGKPMQSVSYQIRQRSSGIPNGVLTFSYGFGEVFLKEPEPVVTTAPRVYSGVQQRQNTGSDSGFGTGFVV